MNRIILLVKHYKYWSILFSIAVVASGVGLYLRYVKGLVWADATGFEDKTLWDLMELLIIPVGLAIVAYFFSKSEQKRDQESNEDQQRAEALQN